MVHIEQLKKFLVDYPQIFGTDLYENDELYDVFDRFMYEWSEYAQTNLNWTKAIIGSIAMSLEDITDKEGGLIIPTNIRRLNLSRVQSDCGCNQVYDFCSYGFDCKEDDDCYATNHGCGWITVQKCNGECVPRD